MEERTLKAGLLPPPPPLQSDYRLIRRAARWLHCWPSLRHTERQPRLLRASTLFAAVLSCAVAASFAPAHAPAADWSTTLTVGHASSNDGRGYSNPHYGGIDDDTFVYDGTTYGIDIFRTRTNDGKRRIHFSLRDQASGLAVNLPSALVNHGGLQLKWYATHLFSGFNNPSPGEYWSKDEVIQYFGDVGERAALDLAWTLAAPGDLAVTWQGEVSWTGSTLASEYKLRYRQSGSTVDWTEVASVSSPHMLPSLTAGTAYDVQVASVNTQDTTWSDTRTFTWYPTTVPVKPDASTATPGPASFAVSFTQSDAAAHFDYQCNYRKQSGSTWSGYATFASPDVSGTTVSGTITGLEAETAYVIRLRTWPRWRDRGDLRQSSCGPQHHHCINGSRQSPVGSLARLVVRSERGCRCDLGYTVLLGDDLQASMVQQGGVRLRWIGRIDHHEPFGGRYRGGRITERSPVVRLPRESGQHLG